MKNRCTVCSSAADDADIFSTLSGNVCRECVNSMSIYELSELADGEGQGAFISRLAEFIDFGGEDEEI